MILMSQQVLIPYETVKAYYASQVIALYNGDSSGQSDSFFHVKWTTDGFTGVSWDINNPMSPADGWSEGEILEEISSSTNLDEMFNGWDVSSAEKLEWMLNWMNQHPGCITE